MKIKIPIKTISEANTAQFWAIKAKRRKTQANAVKLYLNQFKGQCSLPCQIKITRIAPRELDFDNLLPSLKAVTDSVADFFIPGLKPGRADGDKRLKFSYDQRKGNVREYAVEVEIIKDE